MKRKTLIILIALVLLAVFRIGAIAETSGDWNYTIESGGLVITGYTGTDANVVIPDALDGYKVSIIGRQAFKNQYTIRSITIPTTISSIRAEAFWGCSGLSEIYFNAVNCTIPDVWIYSDNRGVGVFSGAGSASATGLKVFFGSSVETIPDKLFDTASLDTYGHNGYPYAYVNEVFIPDSVKVIGARAFLGCQDLTTIHFGSNVQQIGERAFYRCKSIKELEFPDSLAFINGYSFCECTSLSAVKWGNGMDTIGDYAFNGCSSLKEANLVAPLSTIGINAFSKCISLEKITVPTSVTTIKAEAFLGTVKLSQINYNAVSCTVPDVWVYDDNRGYGVFSGAGSSSVSGLTITFGSGVENVPAKLFDTASVSEYGHNGAAYAYLTDIVFSGATKTIGSRAFYNCQKLSSVTFGENITDIGSSAFWGCVELKSIVFNNHLTVIGESAFSGCSALTSIEWGSGLDEIGKNAFYGCSSLKTLQLPTPLTIIGIGSFAECSSLETLVIPATVTKLNGEAFINTVKLNSITFNASDCVVSDVWIYDDNRGAGVFSGSGSGSGSGLKVSFGSGVKIIPKNLFETASISEYGHNGYAYAYVTEVTIPATVEEISSYVFRTCEKLVKVTIEGMETVIQADSLPTGGTRTMYCHKGSTAEAWARENGYAIEYLPDEEPDEPTDEVMVGGCVYKLDDDTNTASLIGVEKTSIKKITIPATVSAERVKTAYKVTAIADDACGNLKKLTSVSIGKNVKTIGESAFAGCIKLSTVTGGAAVIKIGNSAFSGCKVLKNFAVMSKLQTIGASAFKGCVKLTKFTLGKAVKSIGKNAFNGCKGMKAIDVKTTKLTDKNVGAGAFKNIYKKAKITCPKSKLKAYKKLFVKKGAPKTCVFQAAKEMMDKI